MNQNVALLAAWTPLHLVKIIQILALNKSLRSSRWLEQNIYSFKSLPDAEEFLYFIYLIQGLIIKCRKGFIFQGQF